MFQWNGKLARGKAETVLWCFIVKTRGRAWECITARRAGRDVTDKMPLELVKPELAT